MHIFQKNIATITKIIKLEIPSAYDIDFNLKLFIQILHPLRVATIVFSQNDCCLSDVYQIVTEIIKQNEKAGCILEGFLLE